MTKAEKAAAKAAQEAEKAAANEGDTPEAEVGNSEPVELVAMVRDPAVYDEPHTCDVHPDEVDNYKQGGWTHAD
jgi:hypothetical protein